MEEGFLLLVTVGHYGVGKSTLLERGWLSPQLKRKPAQWSKLDRTTSVLLFQHQDADSGIEWMVRDLPGQPEFYATNLHFLSADCAVFLLVCKLTDSEEEREQQLRLWLSALDSLGAYHRACRTVLVCTHKDELKRPGDLSNAQAWLAQLTQQLRADFKHAHLDATSMLIDCETRHLAPAMLAELRKHVSIAGLDLLRIPELATVPEMLTLAQSGLAKWRRDNLTRWLATYDEALEIVSSLLITNVPKVVLRELIYQGDVMTFGRNYIVLSPIWLALVMAVLVRPAKHPFRGLEAKRGQVSREKVQKALLDERWPASMVPTLSEDEQKAEADATTSEAKGATVLRNSRALTKTSSCQVCHKEWTRSRRRKHCKECGRSVCADCSEKQTGRRFCKHCIQRPRLAREEDVPQVLDLMELMDVLVPLEVVDGDIELPASSSSSSASVSSSSSLSSSSSSSSSHPVPSLSRQLSTSASRGKQFLIPSKVGVKYCDEDFAPQKLGLGEQCLAAGVKFCQRETTGLRFPPGFMAVLSAQLFRHKLGSQRLARFIATHEFYFSEIDQPKKGDKGALRVVLDKKERELFLCVAGSLAFVRHYTAVYARVVQRVLQDFRWGRTEESACTAHLLCQHCLLKGRGPRGLEGRGSRSEKGSICEVLDGEAWATGPEGLSIVWGWDSTGDRRGSLSGEGKETTAEEDGKTESKESAPGGSRHTSVGKSYVCEIDGSTQKQYGLEVSWGFFLSHTQRDAKATLLASELDKALGKEGLSCWLDVDMDRRDVKAMEEGVRRSQTFVAIVTDNSQDSYFSRMFCRQEVKWALDAGKRIVPVVWREDKLQIAKFIEEGRSHGLDFGAFDFCTFDRSSPSMKKASIEDILKAAKSQR